MADETTVLPSAAEDLATWTTPTDTIASEPATGRMSPKAKAFGIAGTAVAVGVVGVLVMQSGSSASTANGPGGRFGGGPPGFQQGQGGGPGQQNGFRGGFGNRGGLSGTVSAVSSASITVDGTTVKVTSATQVVVNGTQGSISDVTKGATAFVRTTGTGSSQVAERIVVGDQQGFGGPGGFPGGGQGGPGFGGPPGTQQNGTGSTNSSTTRT